ncbi:protein of unknown function [Pararobbsia alpina]
MLKGPRDSALCAQSDGIAQDWPHARMHAWGRITVPFQTVEKRLIAQSIAVGKNAESVAISVTITFR